MIARQAIQCRVREQIELKHGDFIRFPEDGWKHVVQGASGDWRLEPVSVEDVAKAAMIAKDQEEGDDKPSFIIAKEKSN